MANSVPLSFENAQAASSEPVLALSEANPALFEHHGADLSEFDNLFNLFVDESPLPTDPVSVSQSTLSPQEIMDMEYLFNNPKPSIGDSAQNESTIAAASIAPLDILADPTFNTIEHPLFMGDYSNLFDMGNLLHMPALSDEAFSPPSSIFSSPIYSRRGSVSSDVSSNDASQTLSMPPAAFDALLLSEDMSSILSLFDTAGNNYYIQSNETINPEANRTPSNIGKVPSSNGRHARAASIAPYHRSESQVTTQPIEATATPPAVGLDGKVQCPHCPSHMLQKNLPRHSRHKHAGCTCTLCAGFAKAEDNGHCPICKVTLSSKWNLQVHLIGHYQGPQESRPTSAKEVRERVFDAKNKILGLEALKTHKFY